MPEPTRTEHACPTCGERGVPIVYGLPGSELVAESERGEVIIGGCCVIAGEPMPNLGCVACGDEWHDPDYLDPFAEAAAE